MNRIRKPSAARARLFSHTSVANVVGVLRALQERNLSRRHGVGLWVWTFVKRIFRVLVGRESANIALLPHPWVFTDTDYSREID